MNAFEATVTHTLVEQLRAHLVAKGVSLDEPRPVCTTDMTTAFKMARLPSDSWGITGGFALVEVPPGSFDISQESKAPQTQQP